MDKAEQMKSMISSLKGSGKIDLKDETIPIIKKAVQNVEFKHLIAEKPNIKWSDVIGLEKAKESLAEFIILPIKFPQLFSKFSLWKNILLYGVF